MRLHPVAKVTARQAAALAALMLGVREYDTLPGPPDVIDGCYAAGADPCPALATIHGVAERMNTWQVLRRATASSAARLLEALVRQGFAARVFLPTVPLPPRYIATQVGATYHRRTTSAPAGPP